MLILKGGLETIVLGEFVVVFVFVWIDEETLTWIRKHYGIT